jgi:hypothetical protein
MNREDRPELRGVDWVWIILITSTIGEEDLHINNNHRFPIPTIPTTPIRKTGSSVIAMMSERIYYNSNTIFNNNITYES